MFTIIVVLVVFGALMYTEQMHAGLAFFIALFVAAYATALVGG